jgi:hypothetical protein
VARLYQQLEGRVEVVWPIDKTEYGTLEFGIKDPDGYTLAFAEQKDELPDEPRN